MQCPLGSRPIEHPQTIDLAYPGTALDGGTTSKREGDGIPLVALWPVGWRKRANHFCRHLLALHGPIPSTLLSCAMHILCPAMGYMENRAEYVLP